jgi:hypothetical protein
MEKRAFSYKTELKALFSKSVGGNVDMHKEDKAEAEENK